MEWSSALLVKLTILFVSVQIIKCDKTTVVVPDDTNKTQVGLLMIPGAGISADQYLPLGKQIQKVSNYSVYLATVGGFIANTPNPAQLPGAIKDAISLLHKAGLNTGSPVFMGAHSLGGVFLDMYARGKDNMAAGIILYGSYISKSVKLSDYPVPVLTMSGDQDGLCRMTRIAEDFGQLSTVSYKTPVVIVPGANHSQVASGKMPLNVEVNDLIADNTEAETHQILAAVTNAFMVVNGPQLVKVARMQAAAVIGKQYLGTKNIITPYLEAVQMDTSPFPTSASFAAMYFTGISDTHYDINVRSGLITPDEFLSTEPTVLTPGNKTINLTVPIHNDMPFNPLDVSLSKQSPNQMWVKSISEQATKQIFPNATYYPKPIEAKDANHAASATAVLGLPFQYNARYMAKGRRLQYATDTVCASFDDWKSASITWNHTATGDVKVTSPVFRDDKFVYAKVLTLSRVYEWILIDAFKK